MEPSLSPVVKPIHIIAIVSVAVLAAGTSYIYLQEPSDLAATAMVQPQVAAVAAAPAPTPTTGITIAKNSKSPSGDIVPRKEQVLGVFDVTAANVGTTTYLTSVTVDIFASSTTQNPTLSLGKVSLTYGYCLLSGYCTTIPIQATTTKTSTGYRVMSKTVKLPVANNQLFGALVVSATPIYSTVSSSTPTSNSVVMAQISAQGTDAVNYSGASGDWLTVLNGLTNAPPATSTPPGTGATSTPAVLSIANAPTTAVATKSTNGFNTQETGTFTFTFNVTAVGGDLYVSSTTNAFTPKTVFGTSGAATTTVAVAMTSSATRSGANNFLIPSGQTKTFTVTFIKSGQNGYAYAKLLTLKYGTSEQTVLANTATFPAAYQTATVYLSN